MKTGHWTSHPSRCDRQLGKRFGDAAYAMEELIAELSSAYTMATLELELTPRADHAAYIDSWLKVLKADSKAIFTAASKAQQACDWADRAGRRVRPGGGRMTPAYVIGPDRAPILPDGSIRFYREILTADGELIGREYPNEGCCGSI